MRKITLLVVSIFAVSSIFFFGCTSTYIPVTYDLSTPEGLNITQFDSNSPSILNWDNVDGADEYVVSIGLQEFIVESNRLNISGLEDLKAGQHQVAVRARGSRGQSRRSQELRINKLEEPSNLRLYGNLLMWDEVDGANSYVITGGGRGYQTLDDEIGVDLGRHLPASGVFRISARGRGRNAITSNMIEFEVVNRILTILRTVPPLVAPEITLEGNIVVTCWEDMPDVLTYELEIYGSRRFTRMVFRVQSTIGIDLASENFGSQELILRARVSNGIWSDWSEPITVNLAQESESCCEVENESAFS